MWWDSESLEFQRVSQDFLVELRGFEPMAIAVLFLFARRF
jgi:hypothetical protein